VKQLKQSEVPELRREILEEQDFICPLCEKPIHPFDAALDHDHETGQIRGVLHLTCNSFEGMVKHKFRRSGVHKKTDLIQYLINLINYLQRDQYDILHPTCIIKKPRLKKASYNKLKKLYSGKRKFPDYPKSQTLTEPLKKLYEEHGLEPEYYAERKTK